MENIDEKFMLRALELAGQAAGRTSPNPLVGAVIVKDSKIIGEGYHRRAGTPHAEIHALNAAGSHAAGAALYVSLEPCCHYGKTPPCTEAIKKAGIKRVVAAIADPDSRVSGQGFKALRAAGIETKVGVLQEAALQQNEIFFKYVEAGLPFVAMKTGMTLDGKIAAYTGDSRFVTGEESRKYVHQLRNTYDAILVGIGTVLADDPQLNTRLDTGNLRDPIRVIIDGNLDLPQNSKIALSSHKQKTILFCGLNVEESKVQKLTHLGLEIIRLPLQNNLIPLREAMEILASREITSVLAEGGAEINASLIDANLVDKIYSFIAPKIIGGRAAPTPVAGNGLPLMGQAREVVINEVNRFGKDVLIISKLKNQPGQASI